MKIRFAFPEDLPKIIEIYNQAINAGGTTADLTPLNVADKLQWFNEHSNDDYPIYIIEESNQLIGWGALSAYRKGRRGLRQTAEISYFLDYKYHGKGYAKKLIDYMIKDCARLGIANLFAILLEVNLPSINLLQRSGFVKWGYLPRVADLNGKVCGQFIYGRNLVDSTA